MVFVATTDRPAAAPSEQLSHVTASNGGNLVSHASAAPQSQPAPRAAGAAQDDAVVGSCIVLLKEVSGSPTPDRTGDHPTDEASGIGHRMVGQAAGTKGDPGQISGLQGPAGVDVMCGHPHGYGGRCRWLQRVRHRQKSRSREQGCQSTTVEQHQASEAGGEDQQSRPWSRSLGHDRESRRLRCSAAPRSTGLL